MPPRDKDNREPHEVVVGPKLVIGYDAADSGDGRPLPAGTVFYCSPLISISTADPNTGLIPPGVPAMLTAHVQNLCTAGDALGTKVTFWYAKPSLGALTDIKPIGQSEEASLSPGAARLLECTTPWTPSLDDGAHQCLVVHAECLGDTVEFPWRADADRRVGQKNLTVTTLAAQTMMTLTITNPFATSAFSTLHMQSWRVEGIDPDLARHLGAAPTDLLAHASDPNLRRLLTSHGVRIDPTEPTAVRFGGYGSDEPFSPFDAHTLAQLRQRTGNQSAGRVISEATLPAGIQRQVLFRSDGTTGEAAVHVHQLTQVIDGIEIGGYTIVTLP